VINKGLTMRNASNYHYVFNGPNILQTRSNILQTRS